MMKKIIMLSCLLLLVAGCTTTVPSQDSLLSSLKFGVLKDTRLAQWRQDVIGSSRSQLDIQYLNEADLKKNIVEGNLDVIIGLPATDKLIEEGYWSSSALEVRRFNFYSRADDLRKLHRYIFFSSFVKQLSNVGYVSEGEAGVVNNKINELNRAASKLVPCGTLVSCINRVNNGELDALFADERSVNTFQEQHQDSKKQLLPSKFASEHDFTLLVNKGTVSIDEFNELNRLLR